MANAGFSAATSYFGTIDGLTVTESEDGASSSIAEAKNSVGDTVASDEYGAVIAPKSTYTVTGEVDLSDIALGTVYSVTHGGSTKKVMLTSVEISTSAGETPTVTLSGVEVESSASTKRTYALSGTLTPRSRAQDPFGAFTTSANYVSFGSTAEVDADVPTKAGTPIGSDCFNGRITVSAEMTDGAGTGAITLASNGGFSFQSAPSASSPDAGYVTRSATAVKYLAGTDASASGS